MHVLLQKEFLDLRYKGLEIWANDSHATLQKVLICVNGKLESLKQVQHDFISGRGDCIRVRVWDMQVWSLAMRGVLYVCAAPNWGCVPGNTVIQQEMLS